MFDAAKNFVIQHGVFIEVRDSARLYASKLCKHPRSKTSNSPLDARFSKYRRIRQGDIKLVDSVGKYWQPQNTDDAHDDYIVEVAGENRKRMARFYNGESAYARFEMELDALSNLMHPRIAQVFGLCYPTNSLGIVFHDNGFTEFAISLDPLQRAAFCMKYTEEYYDATTYLYNHFRDEFFAESKIYCSMFKKEGKYSRIAECYVDSHRHLIIILSIGTPAHTRSKSHKSYVIPDTNWNVLDRNMLRPSRNDIELVQSVFEMDKINIRLQSQRIKYISTWHSVLLSSRRIHSRTRQEEIVKLGRTVRMWGNLGGGDFPDHLLYIPGSFECPKTIFREDFKRSVVWTHTDNLLLSQPARIGKVTRFFLNATVTESLLLSTGCQHRTIISTKLSSYKDQLCRVWLSQAPEIQHDLGLTNISGYHLGIVTDVQIQVDIKLHHIPLHQLIKNNPNAEIQLLISDPGINYEDGTIIQPSVSWLINIEGQNVDKVLNRLFSAEISLYPIINYWNTFVYDALHELYRKCDLDISDVSRLLHIPKFNQNQRETLNKTQLYIEDKAVDFFFTEYEKYNTLHSCNIPVVKIQQLSSLSWIGVTIFEDHLSTRETRYGFKGGHDHTKCTYSMSMPTGNEGWEDIMTSDLSNIVCECGESWIEAKDSSESINIEWEDVV